jgi:hypothetical protein
MALSSARNTLTIVAHLFQGMKMHTQLGTGIRSTLAFAQPRIDPEMVELLERGRQIHERRDHAIARGLPCAALTADECPAYGAWSRHLEAEQVAQRAVPVRRVRPVKPTDEIKRAAQLFRGPTEAEMPEDDATVSPENPGILLAMGFMWARGAGLVAHGMSSAAAATVDHNAIPFDLTADRRNRAIQTEYERLVREAGTAAAEKFASDAMREMTKVAPPSQREILAKHVQTCADEILTHILASIQSGEAWPHVMAEVQRRNAHARVLAAHNFNHEAAERPVQFKPTANVRAALAGTGVPFGQLRDYIESYFGSYIAPRD